MNSWDRRLQRAAIVCRQNCLAISLLLAAAILAGCASPSTVATAPAAAPGGDGAAAAFPADRTVTLPSGATLKTAPDWTVAASKDGVTLEDPERQLQIDLVEIQTAGGMAEAINAAWASRRPGFARQELAASDSPGRRGWDLFRWSRYKTSPEEGRRVSAFAARSGGLTVVVLVDGALAAAQRRSSQLALVHDSLRPAGYVRETYRGRTPRTLDAARVAGPEDVHRSNAGGG